MLFEVWKGEIERLRFENENKDECCVLVYCLLCLFIVLLCIGCSLGFTLCAFCQVSKFQLGTCTRLVYVLYDTNW